MGAVAEKIREVQRLQALRHGNSAIPSGARTVNKRMKLISFYIQCFDTVGLNSPVLTVVVVVVVSLLAVVVVSVGSN